MKKWLASGLAVLFWFHLLDGKAQVPQLISYQGLVTANGANFNGAGQFKFALVNSNATVTFWSNDGTSSGGSEPGTAVSLNVAQGLFTVLLGDATMPNMTVISAAVFTHPEVRLRVWFNDGINGFHWLSPDRRIAAVGYAMMAGNVPDASITAAKLADGAVTSSKLAASAVTAANIADGAITSSRLAPLAAAVNLSDSGQSAVGSGGIILSDQADATSLTALGYIRVGSADIVQELWQLRDAPSPSPRSLHTAVWTGSEMIIWGGFDGVKTLNDGAIYDPTVNRWTPIKTGYEPGPRVFHTAVWTGSNMIVWGGDDLAGHVLGDGAAYDPVANFWSLINASGAPDRRAKHSAVWTGAEMVIWGAHYDSLGRYVADGARYNPATNGWTAITNLDAPDPRTGQTAVWTGKEMIIWGGGVNTGGRYSVASNQWTALPFLTAPSGRFDHSAVWTGTDMVVWGGKDQTSDLNDGGIYDPASNRWSAMRLTGAPSARSAHTAIWTGSEMLIWGGVSSGNYLNDGARFNLDTNGWSSAIASFGAPSGRAHHTTVWTDREMIVWGGNATTNAVLNDGGRYDPATGAWTPTAIGGLPHERSGHTAVWTGNEMIVWGGNGTYGNQVGPFKDGVRYNPATGTWTATTTFGAPSPRLGHTAVWTGTEMIIWGGSGVIYPVHLADGGRYDPTTDSWLPLNNIDAPSPRDTHTAIWTGSEMIIWGGSGGSPYFYFNDGARYDPLTDTWTATSLKGAPPERALHSVAWTGSEMIVWGGQGTNGASLRSGGRYDPVSDSWRDTTLANAPANRYQHAAVWTGTEMIVWGGYGLSGASDTGARYNPASDNWTMVSLAGAPPPRYRPTAVWTGMEMIIWGDREGGGRYDPAADAWSPVTSIGEPLATRSGHSAVWTGREMLICGGADTSGSAITSTYGYVAPRKLYVYLLP